MNNTLLNNTLLIGIIGVFGIGFMIWHYRSKPSPDPNPNPNPNSNVIVPPGTRLLTDACQSYCHEKTLLDCMKNGYSYNVCVATKVNTCKACCNAIMQPCEPGDFTSISKDEKLCQALVNHETIFTSCLANNTNNIEYCKTMADKQS